MNFFEKVLKVLDSKMIRPTSYGWFHLMFVAFAIVGIVLLCVFARNAKDKTFRRIVLFSWIVMVIVEIYKQVNFSWSYVGGKSVWDYQWYAFPYQLCSTPLYLLPFIAFMKEGNFRKAIIAFTMTFAFFGGLVTYVYPESVFVSTIGINFQTMIHHGLQVVLGIYMAVYFRKELNLKFFARGILVFVVMIMIAFGLNLLAPYFTTEEFNMFFIGPHYPCSLPLLDKIYFSVPYPVFLIIYFAGFILSAFIMFIIFYLSTIKCRAKNEKQID